MRPHWIVSIPFVLVGCATHAPVAVSKVQTSETLIAAVEPTKLVETRYEVRGYREAATPQLRHEAHAIYRQTRVPAPAADKFATVPRTSTPSLTDSPLPESTELGAELATQKSITAELRALQVAMAETDRQMQAQYAVLVRQSAEVLKLRQQLETERQKVHATPAVESSAPTPPPAETGTAAEVKW